MVDSSLLRTLRAYGDSVAQILAGYGLTDPRVAAEQVDPPCLVVTPDEDVELGDLIDAEDALSDYLGEAVELVSVRSDLGAELVGCAVAL